MKPISSTQFKFSSLSQWSIWQFLVELPLHVQEPQNKNGHIARYERKLIVPGIIGLAQLATPGQVNDLKLMKIAKFWLESYINKVLQWVIPEN